MPRKKKEKLPSLDYELFFSDVTMAETDGKFKDVKKLMDEDCVGKKDWCVRTKLTIISVFGEANMVLNLFRNGDVFIVGYSPSVSDIYYNTDITALSRWCQSNGWKVPQPSPDIVKDNMQFWKYMWETMIVNSDYLFKRLGERKSEDMRKAIEQREKEIREDQEAEEMDIETRSKEAE